MKLRAGFARADITPEVGGHMAGSPRIRPSRGVHLPLSTRVAVFDDGERRAAIVALDLVGIMTQMATDLRAVISEERGIAADLILIACTHTHNGPCTTFSPGGQAPDTRYADLLAARTREAASAAAARMEEVELRYGQVVTQGIAFSRRPLYEGGEVGTGGPMWVDEFVAPEGPVDPQLQALLAVRSDGSLAGGLVGFASHPTVMTVDDRWSPDFPGVLTRDLDREHGGTFLFLQGASADVYWRDRRLRPEDSDLERLGPARRVERIADGLRGAFAAASAAANAIGEGAIQASTCMLEIDQRAPTAEQLELATWFLKQAPHTVDLAAFNRRIYGHAYTFYGGDPATDAAIQEWFALEAIGMHWRNAYRPAPELVKISALRIGEAAFVAYPAEIFTEFGLRTKAESPFAATFVCSLANGWFGYVPTLEAFDHGGYEPRLRYSSRLVPEAGDRMTDAALGLLQKLVAPCEGGAAHAARRRLR